MALPPLIVFAGTMGAARRARIGIVEAQGTMQ